VTAAGPVVEKFAATSGRWLGWLGIVIGVVVVGSAVVDHNASSLGTFAFGLAVGVVSWVALVRPRVTLHSAGVLLRNMVRDVYVPFSAIERTHAGQTLQVRTADKTYHGIGVSRSARTVLREAGVRGSLNPMGLIPSYGGSKSTAEPEHTFAKQEQSGGPYATYVEQRVSSEADAAPDDGSLAVSSFDVVSIGALVLSALVVAAAFLA
jgi:hypothetical protein